MAFSPAAGGGRGTGLARASFLRRYPATPSHGTMGAEVTVTGVLGDEKVASVFVPGFLPSTHGLRFPNSWPSVPNWTIPLPAGGSIPLGNASNGLCGGMTYAVRDLYQAGQAPPPQTTAPGSGPLFSYIAARLLDSWNLPSGVVEYLALMNPLLPDVETLLEPLGHGRAWIMINRSWPAIRGDLNAGMPSPVSLIRVKSLNPMDLGINHQVLAYGYELTGTALTIYFYDPNHPDDDAVTMSLNIANPAKATPVRYSADNEPVYCFFRSNYTFRSPASVAGK
ncbi:MAG TPA: hypothetical protein VHZ03_39530 [Trebonia sp.]|nr:hypothetical protein [Trebonia sp.]